MKEITQIINLSRQTIRRLEKADKFPKSLEISPRRIAWKRHEVMKWLLDQRKSKNYSI